MNEFLLYALATCIASAILILVYTNLIKRFFK